MGCGCGSGSDYVGTVQPIPNDLNGAVDFVKKNWLWLIIAGASVGGLYYASKRRKR